VSQTRSDAEDLDGAPEAVEPQDAVERTKATSKTAVKDKAKKKERKSTERPAKKAAPRKKRTSPALFYRQIVAELRKVVWPTRTELFTYTSVVIVFVLCIIGIVALIDFGLTRAVQAVFG
jgi:preprotein translocase subunit SecE